MARPPAALSPRSAGRSWLWALLAVAWMAAIFYVSSGPVPAFVPDAPLDLVLKKAGHFTAYALLAILWWRALVPRLSARDAVMVAFLLAAAYAGLDEFHQSFTPTRHPSIVDVGIDSLGAATGLWLAGRVWGRVAARVAAWVAGWRWLARLRSPHER